jgi:hypothetical protein
MRVIILLLILAVLTFIVYSYKTREQFMQIQDFPELSKQDPVKEKFQDLYANKRSDIEGKGSFGPCSKMVDLVCPGSNNVQGIILHASKVDGVGVGGIDLVCNSSTNLCDNIENPSFIAESWSPIASGILKLPLMTSASNVPLLYVVETPQSFPNSSGRTISIAEQAIMGVTVFYDEDTVTGISSIRR